MSDSTSMFMIYVLELLLWDGDTTSAKLYYPTVKRGAQWQMAKAATYGVPLGLQTTYDIIGLEKYQVTVRCFAMLTPHAAFYARRAGVYIVKLLQVPL